MTDKKLIRENFKNLVFLRDHNKCVMCGRDAIDAHHITDRSKMPNGGYVVSNGISLCSTCHIIAEKFHISNGTDWTAGYHPADLYRKIHSSYGKAYDDSLNLL